LPFSSDDDERSIEIWIERSSEHLTGASLLLGGVLLAWDVIDGTGYSSLEGLVDRFLIGLEFRRHCLKCS